MVLLALLLASPGDIEVQVHLVALHSSQGQVCVTVFTNEKGFPADDKKAYRRACTKIEKQRAQLSFKLPPGVYAFSAMHDENNNRKLDTNFLGIPNEGVGSSNDAKGFLGPPSFDDAKLKIERKVKLTITMTYL